MPKRIIVSKIGGPDVLNYENYELSSELSSSMVRIRQTSIGLNFIDTYHDLEFTLYLMNSPFAQVWKQQETLLKLEKMSAILK